MTFLVGCNMVREFLGVTDLEMLITMFATVKGNRAFKLESITPELMFSIFKLFASVIQLNFNGSNNFGTMKISSRQR